MKQRSPIRLVQYFFNKIEAELRRDFQPSESPVEYSASIQSNVKKNEEDPFNFMVELKVETPSPEMSHIPYVVKIIGTGIFQIDSEVEEKDHYALVKGTGTAMLYGAMREFVLILTARTGPYPPLQLPTFPMSGILNSPIFDQHPLSPNPEPLEQNQ